MAAVVVRDALPGQHDLEAREVHLGGQAGREGVREDKNGRAIRGLGDLGRLVGQEFVELGPASGGPVVGSREGLADGVLELGLLPGHPELVHDRVVLEGSRQGGEEGEVVLGLFVGQKEENEPDVAVTVLALEVQSGRTTADGQGVGPLHVDPSMG